MTKEKLERAIELNERMNELDDILRNLNRPLYDHITICGSYNNDINRDYITDLPTEAVVMLRNWYSDQWNKLKEEFDAL